MLAYVYLVSLRRTESRLKTDDKYKSAITEIIEGTKH